MPTKLGRFSVPFFPLADMKRHTLRPVGRWPGRQVSCVTRIVKLTQSGRSLICSKDGMATSGQSALQRMQPQRGVESGRFGGRGGVRPSQRQNGRAVFERAAGRLRLVPITLGTKELFILQDLSALTRRVLAQQRTSYTKPGCPNCFAAPLDHADRSGDRSTSNRDGQRRASSSNCICAARVRRNDQRAIARSG